MAAYYYNPSSILIFILYYFLAINNYSLVSGQYDNRGNNYGYNNPNLQAPQSVQYSNGVLRVNGQEVPQCFWYNGGRYVLNSQVPLVVNGRRIPDYYISPALQSRMPPPRCPQSNFNNQQYGSFNPNVQTVRQTIQHRRGQLRINGIQVPQCFWYDHGRFFVDRQTPYEIIINGRRIPDYYVKTELQSRMAAPRCNPGRWNTGSSVFQGHLATIPKMVASIVALMLYLTF